MDVTYEVRDRIAYVTLNRPARMNAITDDVLSGLGDAFAMIAGDTTVRAAVVAGAGDAFCVGLDIDLLARAFDDHAYFYDVLMRYRSVLLAAEALPVPVVAAVNGLTRAGGLELVLACDVAIAASEARIADHHLAFGIVPGGGATWRLARRIGEMRARDVVFTARWLSGDEAAAIGLALKAVPRATLAGEIESYVDVFRSRSRPALAATKRAMSRGATLGAEEATLAEIDALMEHLSADPRAAEGFRAHVEKREPRWDA